jgi:hypothetical protein
MCVVLITGMNKVPPVVVLQRDCNPKPPQYTVCHSHHFGCAMQVANQLACVCLFGLAINPEPRPSVFPHHQPPPPWSTNPYHTARLFHQSATLPQRHRPWWSCWQLYRQHYQDVVLVGPCCWSCSGAHQQQGTGRWCGCCVLNPKP